MGKQLDLPADEVQRSGLTAVGTSALGSIPASLQAFFDRDPLSLTRPELNSIVEVLRTQRKNFMEAEGEAKNEGRRVNAKKAIKGEKVVSSNIKALMEDM